jgi:hypothetical protein
MGVFQLGFSIFQLGLYIFGYGFSDQNKFSLCLLQIQCLFIETPLELTYDCVFLLQLFVGCLLFGDETA